MSDYNKNEELRYQFILYINDHIVCQRYFNIFDFNEESLESMELKELMASIAGMNNGQHGSLGIIPRYLQKKSLTYLWDNYNPYMQQTEDNIRNVVDRKDNFQFEIKIDDMCVAKTEFSGNNFPPKIRYAVDVREIIPEIMSEIRTYLSQKTYTIDSKTKPWKKSQKEFLVK
jgi:hypothetical protein